ncbi:MAG: TRAP transporter TatT component family protein [Polyangiales bacterium]
MRQWRHVCIGVLGLVLVTLSACDTAKLAADSTAELFGRAAPGVEQHWDYDLVGKSFPASIVQLEGLLRVVPDNEVIGMSLIAAYVGYGNGWIEDRVEVADIEDDWEEADHLRRRALVMYTRSWELSKHFLRNRDAGFDEALKGGVDTLGAWLEEVMVDKADAAILLWAGASLGARINMGMEDMDTVADLPLAKVILGHSVELDPDFMFMLGKMTMGVLAASEFPPDMDSAKTILDDVLEKTERRNLMVQTSMARYYAVNVGDPKLFRDLLQEVIDAGDLLPEARLSNTIARRKAQRYLDQIEYYFSELAE